MYIVSACLLGANCKYNGGNNENEAVKDFCEGHKILAVCPETAGGLTSPRAPAEQIRSWSSSGQRAAGSEEVITDGSESNYAGRSVGDSDGSYGSSTAEIADGFGSNGERDGAACSNDGCVADGNMIVIDKNGRDLTANFIKGAEICLKKVLDSGEEPELAILKANSPSCGSGRIYDGTFTGTLTDGDGVFAAMLKNKAIKVITESDIETVSEQLRKELDL